MARRIGRAARVLFGYLRFIKEGVIVCYCINCILMSLFPHRGSMRCVSDCVDTLLATKIGNGRRYADQSVSGASDVV